MRRGHGQIVVRLSEDGGTANWQSLEIAGQTAL